MWKITIKFGYLLKSASVFYVQCANLLILFREKVTERDRPRSVLKG